MNQTSSNAKLGQHLTAHPTRWPGRIAFAYDDNFHDFDLSQSGNGTQYRAAFGANRGAIRGVFDVATGETLAAAQSNRGSDVEARVRRVRVALRRARHL